MLFLRYVKEASVQNETQILIGQQDWWRRVEDETHDALTNLAHELSDETARTLEYLALLCGALALDAGWDESGIKALTASIGERVPYDYGIITKHVVSLVLTGYRGGSGDHRAS
jgi:hypothetical protein